MIIPTELTPISRPEETLNQPPNEEVDTYEAFCSFMGADNLEECEQIIGQILGSIGES
jgi:hypothetical protein